MTAKDATLPWRRKRWRHGRCDKNNTFANEEVKFPILQRYGRESFFAFMYRKRTWRFRRDTESGELLQYPENRVHTLETENEKDQSYIQEALATAAVVE